MTEVVVILALLAALGAQWWSHDQERRQWARERTALMERCVPGLSLATVVEDGPTPAYGTDGWEWEVEQRRKGAGRDEEVL